MLLSQYKNNKNMKKYILILFIGFLLEGCLDLRNCDSESKGRYYCYNNEKAINWLDIKKDGTFSHYYKEDTFQLSHHGKWKMREKSNCVIEFDSWKSFNEDGKNYEKYGSNFLYKSSNYLDIGPDGESSTSFEKSNEDMSVNPLDK